MTIELGTNQATNQPAAGVQGTNPADTLREAAAGVPDSQDQGLAGQSDLELDEDGNPIPPAIELDEWEDEDGKKYQIPKALAPRLMKDADYTRKTQEHAETVRQAQQQFAQREQQLAIQAQAQQQTMQQRAQLAALDMQLAQYQGVNWAVAAQQDPGAAQQAWLAFQQLKEQRTGVVTQIQTMESQFAAQAQQLSQQAQAQAAEAVSRIVSTWSPDEQAAVNEIGAKAYGVTKEQFQLFAMNPGLLPILRDAVLFQQAKQRASSAGKPAAAPPAGPTPTLQQGSGRATPKSLDDPGLSVDEWMRRRSEQISKRGKR